MPPRPGSPPVPDGEGGAAPRRREPRLSRGSDPESNPLDDLLRPGYDSTLPVALRGPWRPRFFLVGIVVGGALAACATAGAPRGSPLGAEEAGEVAATLARQTRPATPRRVVFRWTYRDRGARFEGRGAARVAPPYRVRLDLFSGRGGTALRTALVGSELRLPPGESPAVTLPPPALLWATLGVFRPGPEARRRGAWRSGEDGVELRYLIPGEGELAFGARGGRLVWAAHRIDGRDVRRVDLSGASGRGVPAETRYRNHRDVRELTIEIESVEDVESFPPQIWFPGS